MKWVGRRGVLGILGLALLPLLSGCGALSVGVLAVGVDADGVAMAHLVVCEKSLDALAVTAEKGNAGRFVAIEPVTTSADVRLAAPGSGWRVEHPLDQLADGVQYSLGGYSEDDHGLGSDDVTFTTADLAALRPGQVFLQEYKMDADNNPIAVDAVRTLAQFQAHACDDWKD